MFVTLIDRDIKELEENIHILENHKDSILNRWLNINEVKFILTKLDINMLFFKEKYATSVINYFISVVKRENQVGSCPTMINLIDFFNEKEIDVSELFTICLNFRKSVIHHVFLEEKLNKELFEDIQYIFDANFRGVLEYFNKNIKKISQDNIRLYNESNKDFLTNIYNRKMFQEIFTKEFHQAKRYKNHFSILMLDIDHFKSVNDNYGHLIGDEILIEFATLISEELRESDTFARWGGEEFIVILSNTSLEYANLKAKSLISKINSYNFDNVGQITCSIGLTELNEDDTKESLIKRVDILLYDSKNNGRDRVTIG